TRTRAAKDKEKAEKEYLLRRSELEVAIKSLREKREGIVEGAEKAIGPELAALSAEEQRIYRQSVHERDLLATQLAALHAAEQSIVEAASRARLRRDDLANNIEQKEREHRVIASESQLHRVSASLAGWWMGKDYEPHTVPEGQVRRVSAVWFGSMAALGALGGAVVAMISQLLMKRSIAGET